jgi:hypothetical protein
MAEKAAKEKARQAAATAQLLAEKAAQEAYERELIRKSKEAEKAAKNDEVVWVEDAS